MKEKSISFNAPMVRSLLEGRKTQTRRIVKPDARAGGFVFLDDDACPYGPPGTRLWVREAWRADRSFEKHAPREIWPFAKIWYEADGPAPAEFGRYRHARYMPLRQSRITLEVTGVRVERLQDISEADAIAEGLAAKSKDGGRTIKYGIPDRDGLPGNDDIGWNWKDWEADPRQAYRRLWEQIDGPGSWAANPWVWVIDFRRQEVPRPPRGAHQAWLWVIDFRRLEGDAA